MFLWLAIDWNRVRAVTLVTGSKEHCRISSHIQALSALQSVPGLVQIYYIDSLNMPKKNKGGRNSGPKMNNRSNNGNQSFGRRSNPPRHNSNPSPSTHQRRNGPPPQHQHPQSSSDNYREHPFNYSGKREGPSSWQSTNPEAKRSRFDSPQQPPMNPGRTRLPETDQDYARAVELKSREDVISQSIVQCKARISVLKAEIMKETSALTALRAERQQCRDAKIQLLNALLIDNQRNSDDEAEESSLPGNIPPPASRSSPFHEAARGPVLAPGQQQGDLLNVRDMLEQIVALEGTTRTLTQSQIFLGILNRGGVLKYQDAAWVMQRFDYHQKANRTATSTVTDEDACSMAYSAVSSGTGAVPPPSSQPSHRDISSEGDTVNIPPQPQQPPSVPLNYVSTAPLQVPTARRSQPLPRQSHVTTDNHTETTVKKEAVVIEETSESRAVRETGRLSSVSATTQSNDPVNTAQSTAPSHSECVNEHVVRQRPSAHSGPILDMRVHKDSIFTCSQDKTAKRFNLKSLEPIRTYEGHEAMVHCLEVVTQREVDILITGGFDMRMILFGVKSGGKLASVNLGERVHCLKAGWEDVYAGLGSGVLVRYNLSSRHIVDKWTMHMSRGADSCAITSLACGKEGARKVIAVGCQNGDIILRDASNGVLLRNLEGHPFNQPLLSLAILSGKVFSLTPPKVMVHDLCGGVLATLNMAEHQTALVVDCNRIVRADVFGSVHLHNLVSQLPISKPTVSLNSKQNEPIMAIALTNFHVVEASKNGELRLVHIPDQEFECKVLDCRRKLTERSDLVGHLVKEHSGANVPRCAWPSCNFTFKNVRSVSLVEDHMETHCI